MNHRAKRKRYHDAKCRKELLRRTKYNRRAYMRRITSVARHSTANIAQHFLHAPKCLDIFEDTENTIAFFSEVLKTVKGCHCRDTVYFDLSEVECITPASIMYIIAIIKNVRRIRALKIACVGNMPTNASARATIEQSGFFSFVSATSPLKIEADSKYMKIANGKDADGTLAGAFCDFVQNSSKKTRLHTKRLYPMIVELMTNTHQHAYEVDTKSIMKSNWYIFARDTKSAVQFVFLDTGVGIPKTVAKRIFERVSMKNDAAYLESVLRGDFRTETRQKHRGKGIPGIYEDACNHSVVGLSIISGRAKCEVDNRSNIKTTSLKEPFEGTLFAWNIPKEGIVDNDN